MFCKQEGDQIMESNITSDSITPLLQTPLAAVLQAVSPLQLHPGPSSQSRSTTPIQLRALTSTSTNQIYPVYGDQV